MRHIHFILAGFLLCICCTLQAKNRVIDQPPFIVRNTTSIEVSKVVISDTATVLHIYAKYRPKNWIQIAPDSYLTDNNGETYQLRSGIGITPGKEFWMPESGEAEFQLVFPPLSDNATSFDFTEGEKVENGFSIWGIQLKSKKLPELALPQNAVVHKADPNAELPEPAIQYGKAMLKGKLLDSRPNMAMPISIAVWENIKGDITDIPLDIQPDGSFTKEVTLPGTTPCTMYLGREHMLQFFMEPGKTTEIYVNLREASRRKSKFHSEGKPYGEMVYINGPLETVAQELNGNHPDIDMQDKLYQNIAALAGKDIDAAKAYVLQISGETQEAIDKLPYSASTRQLLTINNKLITNAMLSSVASILTSAAYSQSHQTGGSKQLLSGTFPESTRQLRVRRRYEHIECAAGSLVQPVCTNGFKECRTEWRIGQSLGNRQRYLLRHSPQCHPLPGYQELHPAHRRAKGHRCRHARRIPRNADCRQ